MGKRWWILVAIVVLLAGCARTPMPDGDDGLPNRDGPTRVPAPTPVPTATPLPLPTMTPLPTSTPTPGPGDRRQPIPFGQSWQIEEEGRTFRLAVQQALRGEEAWQRLLEANRYNDPPQPGTEYLLLYVGVEYLSGPVHGTLRLDAWSFRLVSNNQVLQPPSLVEPPPAFELEFFPGGEGGGWMAWVIYEDDPAPLLAYGLEYDGSGGVFFAAVP
ncbi:MAG: hypothetical protein ACK2UY_10350 [Anaerolineae bacterium]